jgi:hypothetical protein
VPCIALNSNRKNGEVMSQITTLEKFRIPLGNQEVELQQIDHVDGGLSLMRLRIREGRRFTIFDIDPATARHWGEAMQAWAEAQRGGPQ